MTNMTDLLTETTDVSRNSSVIGETLRGLRVGGSVLLRERYADPWAVSIPRGAELARLLRAGRGAEVVAFHLVEFGHCELHVGDAAPRLLLAGDLAVCFGGTAHSIGVGRARRPQPLAALLRGEPNAHRPAGARPATAALTCGALVFHDVDFSPLFAALPAVVTLSPSREGGLDSVATVARLLVDELARTRGAGGYVVERLLEVLSAAAIRAHAERAPHETAGWFGALRDPVVGRAIADVHESPGAHWTVAAMAERVALSPSRFAARFVREVGEPPMAYVTRWRMNLACRRLRQAETSIAHLAKELGYESAAAFNRAFRRHAGEPPARWRARHRAR